MIIIEGVDRCGKSSVAKTLRKILPEWSYRHHTKPPMNPYGYFSGFIADSRPKVIVDRFHWSEPVYGKTFRGSTGLSRIEFAKLDLMCLSQNAKIIYMADLLENIESRWDDQEMFSSSGIPSLIQEYEKVISETPIPFIRCSMTDLLTADNKPTEKLGKFALKCKTEAELTIENPPPSIGSGGLRDANFFIFGPSPSFSGAQKDPDVQFPLSLGYAENAFWECMFDGMPWHKGYYTNSSSYSQEQLRALLHKNESENPIIICLGNEAEEFVRKVVKNYPIASIGHPSHHIRSGNLDPWCSQLQSILKQVED